MRNVPTTFKPKSIDRLLRIVLFVTETKIRHRGEIAVYQSGEKNGRWNTRVFANKYPAVRDNDGVNLESNVGPYRKGDFLGHHEVIVESADHKTSFSQLEDDESDCALKAYRDRIAEYASNPMLKHAMLFKNCRPEAGASIEHLHSQILCTSVTTEKVLRRINRAKQYYQSNRKDVISSIVDFEMAEEQRVVAESANFVAYCPFASRFAYQTAIVPKVKDGFFHQLPDEVAFELGRLMRDIIVRLETCLPNAAYNLLLHIAPFDVAAIDYYQWHIEVFPRLANPAGYEWGPDAGSTRFRRKKRRQECVKRSERCGQHCGDRLVRICCGWFALTGSFGTIVKTAKHYVNF